ncbi:MFS transporter [uncultured Jatrophihabitans sp.]|uniref:MFS transporter n=1 Tax=uncultured Jatrophihabitans sp. TaxID=1610747 RepID=UPI0035C9BE3E
MTSTARAQQQAPGSIFAGQLRATTVGILTLITLIAFEAMAVSAALPTAARELHGLAAYGWAFTGFLVANVVAMVASGQICDARGPRPAVLVGVACFVAGLLVAGTATTMLQLVAGRVVQGLGGGLMITAIYVVMGEAYPSRLRPPLFAATSSAWVVPSLIGPAISGLLAQHASWRWVFLGLAPFCVLGGVLIAPTLRKLATPTTRTGRFAGPSRLARAVAVAAGVAALEQAGQHPSLWAIGIAVAGLLVLVWGIRRLVPAGTFRVRPGVSAAVALRGLLAGAFFGVESTVPLSLTLQHGYGATVAGLPLACAGLSWAFGSWVQGRADDSRGPHVRARLVRAGFGCVAVAAALMAVAAVPGPTAWCAFVSWLIAGFGAGLAMSSASVLLLNFTTDATRGADSAALQLADSTANALTTGIAGVLIAAAARHAIGFTAAFTGVDLAMCAIAAVGFAAAVRARPART